MKVGVPVVTPSHQVALMGRAKGRQRVVDVDSDNDGALSNR